MATITSEEQRILLMTMHSIRVSSKSSHLPVLTSYMLYSPYLNIANMRAEKIVKVIIVPSTPKSST